MKPLPGIYFALLFLFFSATTFAQTTIVAKDSLATDSIHKQFIEQVKKNDAALGIDTTRFVPDAAVAANSDTTPVMDSAMIAKRKARHSPKKAAIMSLILPGLGQAYNKKYWKIPIIYAGFGGLGYALYFTSSNFYGYRTAYRAALRGQTGSYNGVTDQATLKDYRDYYKSNYDISIIVTAVWYILNVVDATVDAHLFEWNMKDDISVSWRPTFITTGMDYNTASIGASIRLKF